MKKLLKITFVISSHDQDVYLRRIIEFVLNKRYPNPESFIYF